jgi:hypothetical protein
VLQSSLQAVLVLPPELLLLLILLVTSHAVLRAGMHVHHQQAPTTWIMTMGAWQMLWERTQAIGAGAAFPYM